MVPQFADLRTTSTLIPRDGGTIRKDSATIIRGGGNMSMPGKQPHNLYTLNEVRALTGYSPQRFTEILKRHAVALERATGKKSRKATTRSATTTARQPLDETCGLATVHADWILYERFKAPVIHHRPKGFVTQKQALEQGLSTRRYRELSQDDRVNIVVYKGRYYIDQNDINDILATLPRKAPTTMIPLVHITRVLDITRQAIHDWVKRHNCGHIFLHPTKRGRAARHLSVYDAYKYIYQRVRSAYVALELLAAIDGNYPRYVGKVARPDMHPATANPLSAALRPPIAPPGLSLNLAFKISPDPWKTCPALNQARAGHVLLPIGP